MRNNGGFILIKINKTIDNITADDFDKKVFRELCEKQIKKLLILDITGNCLLFTNQIITSGSVTYQYTQAIFDDEGNIDGGMNLIIHYTKDIDTLEISFIDF